MWRRCIFPRNITPTVEFNTRRVWIRCNEVGIALDVEKNSTNSIHSSMFKKNHFACSMELKEIFNSQKPLPATFFVKDSLVLSSGRLPTIRNHKASSWSSKSASFHPATFGEKPTNNWQIFSRNIEEIITVQSAIRSSSHSYPALTLSHPTHTLSC